MTGIVRRALRAGIVGVVGPNGSGKDLFIARLAAASLDEGRPLLANQQVNHPGATLMTSLQQLLDWDGDIWLSEITTVAGARESSALPVQVQARLQQLRKGSNGSRLWWSAPSYQRADRVLRECSTMVVKARGMVPERAKDGHVWAPRRLFLYRAYDARDLEDFHVARTSMQAQKATRIRSIERDFYWRPAHSHQSLYDSRARVEVVSAGAMLGTCLLCSGRIVQPVCKGHAAPEPVDLPAPVPADPSASEGNRPRAARGAGSGGSRGAGRSPDAEASTPSPSVPRPRRPGPRRALSDRGGGSPVGPGSPPARAKP